MAKHAAVVICGGVLLAGCGGDSSEKKGGSSATPAATSTPKKSVAPGARKGAVSIKDFSFKPKSITVKRGATVTWTNRDSANHNVDLSSGPKGIANLRTNQRGKVTFTKPGTYKYVCDFHANMTGTVVVR